MAYSIISSSRFKKTENITRTVLQKEDSHSDDKTEKQQTPTAAWKMGCRGHYHNQGNRGVRRPNRY